jgi:predicted amidophosphoribosyltransferase
MIRRRFGAGRHESVLIGDGGHGRLVRVSVLHSAIAVLAPPRCLACRGLLARVPAGPALCGGCAGALEAAPGIVIRADAIDGGFAPLAYAGIGRRLVAALKFSRLLAVAELGAALMAERAPAGWFEASLVPVPAAPARARRRGFDPAWELAAALAGGTGTEAAPVLRRRDRRHQRGRSRSERIARPPRIQTVATPPRRALLVDDVVTTGATIDACARALRGAGSVEVRALALAAVRPGRTPVGDQAPGP